MRDPLSKLNDGCINTRQTTCDGYGRKTNFIKLACTVCKREYTDVPTIAMSIDFESKYEHEHMPCSVIGCKGELKWRTNMDLIDRLTWLQNLDCAVRIEDVAAAVSERAKSEPGIWSVHESEKSIEISDGKRSWKLRRTYKQDAFGV